MEAIPDSVTASVPARENFASAWKGETRPAFLDFKRWTESYLSADEKDRAALLESGVTIAHARREALSTLIESDPRLAIASAVPLMVRRDLPTEILGELEQYVSGEGRLALVGGAPVSGSESVPYFHTARVNGQSYKAFVYGRRERQATKLDISVIGIALNQRLAVSESPVRLLESGETAAVGQSVDALCPISGKTTPIDENKPFNINAPTAVEVAGNVHQLCSSSHVASYETQLIQSEESAGPYSAASTLGDSGPGTSNIAGRPPVSWCQGVKKILIILVDFSDKAGRPVNPADGQSMTEDYIVNRFNLANGVRDWYVQSSYNKTTLSISPTSGGNSADVTQVFRMTNTAAYYATNYFNDALHSAAEALAATNGYVLSNYDRIGVVFADLSNVATNSQITYGGLGEIQGRNFWINGYFDFRVVSHEIGHTYGLMHANLWQVSDGNPVSPNGASIEYGDVFDVMGNGSGFAHQFNHWERNLLQWIPDGAVTNISWPGTYRIYRFDHQNVNLTNALAMKIVRNSARDYWIGFRQAITTNSSLMNGAYILWGYNQVQQSDLLDMTTPGSNVADAALAIGTTFNDSAAGITIKPVAKGGTSGNEYVDLQIGISPRIQWASTTYTFDEKLGSAVLTLTRSGSSNGVVTVNYKTVNGTAVAPADYTATNSSVMWSDGDVSPKTISIPLVADALSEPAESFSVNLTNISGGVIIDSSNAVVSIADSGAFDVTLNQDWIDNSVEEVIVQPDGKLLIGGWFDAIYTNSTPVVRNGIARLNANGTLDTTFGNGSGLDVLPVRRMALQPDGKVLICGNFNSVHGVGRVRVARLNSDGSIDTGFSPGTGPNSTVYAIALQPDGKILVGGSFTNVAGSAREYVARLNSDGTLDTSFVGPDFAQTSGWRVECLAIQPDNKILAAGVFWFSGGPTYRAGIVRMNTNGNLDATFNPGDGAATAGNNSLLQSIHNMALQRDGKIVIVGDFTAYNDTNRNYIARITSSGSLDLGFNPSADNSCYAALVESDGKVFVGGGFASLNSTPLNRFARLNTDGTLDSTFDVGTGSTNWVNTFAMQPDGKLVMGTDFSTIKDVPNRTTARFYAGLPGLSGTVQFTSASVVGAEGSSALLTVSRVGGSYGAISVNYGTITNSAGAADFTNSSGTLSWTNGETSSKTFSVPLVSDGITENDEIFSVNLGVPIGGVFISSPGLSTVTITTGLSLWKKNYFSALELLDSLVSGDLADPDNDGLSNMMEYIAGHNPKVGDGSSKPVPAMQSVSGTNYLTLSFRRNNFAPDLNFSAQSAATVTNAFTNATIQVGSPVNNFDGTETVTWRDTVPMNQAGQRFMRLQVIRTP